MARAHHLNIEVSDVARSREFYEKLLGFDSSAFLHQDKGMLMLRDAAGFDLTLMPGSPNPNGFHFGIRLPSVDELEQVRAAVEAAGIETFKHIEQDSMVSFKCRDPDGYVIEVYWY